MSERGTEETSSMTTGSDDRSGPDDPSGLPDRSISRRFGPFLYDPHSETLVGPDGEVRMRPQVFQLLGLLIREAPRPVPQRRLIDEIWGLAHVSAGSVQRTVSELRTALGDDARSPIYVETVHRRGYRFVAALEPVHAESALGQTPDAEAPESTSPPGDHSSIEAEPPEIPAADRGSARRYRGRGRGRGWAWALAIGLLGTVWVVGASWLESRGFKSSKSMDLTTTEQDTAGSPTGSANLPVGDPAADDSAADDSAADDPAVGEVLGWPVGEAGDALVENVEVTVRLLPPFMSSGQDDPVSVRNRFALLDPAVRSSPSVRLGLAHALAELGWHQQALEQLDAVLEGSQVGPNLPELSKEIVLGVEALHHELQGEGEKALELRQTLATFFPDDFEHGLRLAQAERRFGDPLRAEAILNRLGTDLQQPVLHMRIELERAEVWHARSESEQMLAAAERAAEAARLEDRPYRLAQALLLSGRARHHQKAATEAVADLAAAADLFERLHVARGAAEAQVVWATLLYEQERFDGAREIAEKSLAASVKLEDPVRIARARLQLGRIEIAVGDLDRAIEEITAAMSAYEQAGLEIGASSARTSLAHLRYRQGRLDVAMDLLKSSLDVYRRRKRWENIASSASNLGMVAIEMGRWQDAERSLAEAAEARRQGDMGEGSAYIRLSSARIALNRGELDPAMELALAALEEFRRQGRPSGQLAAHKMLARVDEVSGDLHAAERRLNEAATLPFFSPIAPVDGADARRRFTLALSRARVAMYRGSASQVEKQLELADRLLPQITEPKLKALFLQTRGRWLWWSGEPETGRQAMTEALQEWRTSGRAAMENRACLDLARLALDTGRLDSAEQQIRSVLERSRDLGDDPSAALAWALRAELELQRGKLEVAQTYARISRETAPLTAHDEGRLVLVSAILDPSAEQGADADREIQGILERAEQGGDCRLAVAALGASARLAKKNGQPEKATDKRKQATDRAATCGYGEPSKG